VFIDEVLILKLVSIDTLAAGAVAARKVAALAHEVGDDAVEFAVLVAESLFARAQRAKVLARLRRILEQVHPDLTGMLTADRDVKEYLMNMLV